uniref:Ctd-like (NLI interacting factor-like) phosphatase n=1 Tax=Pithovirus LCPAC103 TaxID=2506588 RepID=A0A481Z4L2_9VIRU|nr:MAG: ctd-like (NLI interacting factor-like) phosphatase [Pithovirus LCPAC103]
MAFYVSKYDTITNKAVVLDLDETLIHTTDDMALLKTLGILTNPKLMALRRRIGVVHIDDVVSSRGSGIKSDLWFIKRPYLKEFLIFCFAYFRVVTVWSAGVNKYVKSIVKEIFKDIKPPVVIYTRDDTVENPSDGEYDKPLSKLISEVPGLSKYMSMNNTLILDDKATTFRANPNNGVLSPKYNPPFTISGIMEQDIALLQFREWLLKPAVISSEDVRTLDKRRIFTTPLAKISKLDSKDSGFRKDLLGTKVTAGVPQTPRILVKG